MFPGQEYPPFLPMSGSLRLAPSAINTKTRDFQFAGPAPRTVHVPQLDGIEKQFKSR